ncbi:MAG: hypothetical protein KIT02_02845 [Devosia sp.]|uniref:hypothetical protein n=1 Tax=Devosia sp. TaxID=1871048 RepID=UPI0024CACF57|nr:hypothetical protein [Devosia sp.]UYO00184.1 MAG: hypothetical protein KIT02_02845 [Devosia sp.]
MSSWADNESALDRARELLANRYPNSFPAIIDTFDIAYCGWECDYMGALITVDGVPEIVVIDRYSGDRRPDIEQVREQLAEYRRLIAETERVLRRYGELAGTVDHVDMHGAEWQLQRDPGESDEDYAARRLLFGDGTGRLYQLRRRGGETDDAYVARVQSFAKVTIKIIERSPTFEQVGFVEQDRRHLKSEIAELQRRLADAREQLAKAEKYLAGGDDEDGE